MRPWRRCETISFRRGIEGVDAEVYVTGDTAINQDFFDLTDQRTPWVFAFVLGLSFLLLMVAFRSIVVPPRPSS